MLPWARQAKHTFEIYGVRTGYIMLYNTESNGKLPHQFIPSKAAIDRPFGIAVSMTDCHPRGPGFDSRLYPRNFSGIYGSGTWSTQPREDNWVAT